MSKFTARIPFIIIIIVIDIKVNILLINLFTSIFEKFQKNIYKIYLYTLTGEVYSVIIIPAKTKEMILLSVTSDLIRGNTDTIILGQLLVHDSYGYEINKSISNISGGLYELKEATLYTAFKRLEEAGYISSYWGDETTGARRKYYTITPLGKQAHARMLEEWNTSKIIIDKLVNNFSDEKGAEL